MRAVFLVLFSREIISYKLKRSFGVSEHGQLQCGISQILIDDAKRRWEINDWDVYDSGKIGFFSSKCKKKVHHINVFKIHAKKACNTGPVYRSCIKTFKLEAQKMKDRLLI